MKTKSLLILLLLLFVFIFSSNALPPIFGDEYNGKTQKDELTRVFISPQKIVWKSNDVAVKGEENLLLPGNSQSEMSRNNTCFMRTTENDTASILLDYGKELHGGLQLVLGSSTRREPSLVRIRFGESVGECFSETSNSGWKVGYSTDDHAKRDIIMEIPRDGMIEIGNTGFRFVRIDLLQINTTIHIKEARAILRYRDIPYLGSFRSSNERLNQIWMTGAYTVHLNMQEYLWDGIKRDRIIWLGDMHPEVAAITTVFGANEVVPKSLDLAVKQFPLPGWINKISTYSLWYLIIQQEWYMSTGDLDYLKKHRNYIVGLIDQIDDAVNEKGEIKVEGMVFLDWPSTPNKNGVNSGAHALMIWALKDAQKICHVINEKNAIEKAEKIIGRLKSNTPGHFNLKQAAALKVISGISDAKTASDEVILVGGAKNFTTFYGYYMLEALAKAGKFDEAIDIISQYWGGMLDLGATTFWEDFDLDWAKNSSRLDELTPEGKTDIHGDFGAYCYPGYRHSFCHGWAAGPTAWMSRHILGVKVLEPGFKKIKVEPHLGDLDWVEGTFPTPYGIIKINHTKAPNGKITSKIEVPKGVKLVK